jgi:hypothetical protein
MAILVTCPGCHQRFSVSDKFAGRTGPCPKCKTPIRVPTENDELQIHEPKNLGAGVRGSLGDSWAKPITRSETNVTPVGAVLIGGSAVLVLGVTWILGRGDFFKESAALGLIGLLLISPPLVIAGYWILRDDESLEPRRGKELYIRAGICSLIYIVLWGVYGYVVDLELITGELWTWLIAAPAFLVSGGLAALVCLDFEFGPGFFHYCFYLMVTVFLRWLAGMGWVWDIPEKPLL